MFHDLPAVLLMMPVFAITLILIIMSSYPKKTITEQDASYRFQHHHRERRRLKALDALKGDRGHASDQAA